jgi:transposase
MVLPQMLQFCGYEIKEMKPNLEVGKIDIHLHRKNDKEFNCAKCGSKLNSKRGTYGLKLREMDVMGFKAFLHLFRVKGDCPNCKKARSEAIDFIAAESPHLTKGLAWWLGKLCEITAVSRAGEFVGEAKMTMWRVDLARMKRMFKSYVIPEVTEISVDEVYVRNKPRNGESRDDRFFTIVTDLKSRRVIWVEESRKKEALDQFFKKIGPDRCGRIRIVACDQFNGFRLSVAEFCPNATLVWDRFHIMKKFEESVNETRKLIHDKLVPSYQKELIERTKGKYRFVFLKKASRRTAEEAKHIQDVQKDNKLFCDLEIIKERMLTFFDQRTAEDARVVFNEIGKWIREAGFPHLKLWHKRQLKNWSTLRNYFTYRVTSALSEGTNNVIKTMKRKAFGYRNMEYFRLKILQVCGFLNSRHMLDTGLPTKRYIELIG